MDPLYLLDRIGSPRWIRFKGLEIATTLMVSVLLVQNLNFRFRKRIARHWWLKATGMNGIDS